jgi:hypothetical protein
VTVELWSPAKPEPGKKPPAKGQTLDESGERIPSVATNAELRVMRLDEKETETLCAAIERRRTLATHSGFHEVSNATVLAKETIVVPEGDTKQQQITLRVDSAGTVVLDLAVSRQNDSTAHYLACVVVEGDETQPHFWTQIAVAPGFYEIPYAAPGDATHFSILVGASRKDLPLYSRVSFALNFVAGFTALYRHARTPPSWEDVASAPGFSDSGELSMSWLRRAFLLGVLPEFRWQATCGFKKESCAEPWRSLSLFGRAGPFIDAGFISTDQVPAELDSFRDQRPAGSVIADLDLTIMGQVGASARITTHVDLELAWDFWLLGVDDLVTDRQARIFHDAIWGMGIGVGFGYRP